MKEQNKNLCPICGQHRFPDVGDQYNVCPHCGWTHDMISEENPSEAMGPNSLSLFDHKCRYMHYTEQNPDYHYKRDGYPQVEQVEPLECPVCKKYRFERLTWDDIYSGLTPSDVYCTVCGWHYDPCQLANPELRNGANVYSLNEYREWYEKRIQDNPDYNYFDEMTDNYIPSPHKCPVCGKYEFEDECCYDICPYCGWEDDGTEDDTSDIGANDLKFSEYKKRYESYLRENPNYRWEKDGSL